MINCLFSIIFSPQGVCQKTSSADLWVAGVFCRFMKVQTDTLRLELRLDNACQDNGRPALSRPIYTQIMETGPKTLLGIF